MLFLLPVLQRLGYVAWADSLPERAAAQIVRNLLAVVLRRLRAPSEDSAWLLASTRLDNGFGSINAKAPAAWADPILAAPRGSPASDLVALAEQPQSPVVLAYVWLIACRRWLRRQARIGIASLVVRPAALSLTATHVDIYFSLSDVNMKIRRAGLDFDLGWIPWYERIVTFCYTQPDKYLLASSVRETPNGN